MTDNQQDVTLYDLIEKIFNFSEYSDTEKEEKITETAGLIMEAALLQALNEGKQEVQEKFDAFMATDPDDLAMNTYIQEHIPNFQDYVVQELQALKDFNQKENLNQGSAVTE